MNTIIASSAETTYGSGTLFKWDEDEVSYRYDKDRGWVVTELATGRVFICFDVMKLSPSVDCIEQEDISHLREE